MKKIVMLLALAGVSAVAVAQQETVTVEETGVVAVQDKYQVITNPFWSNWFISVGGGAEVTFGDGDSEGSFGKRISPTLNFSVGKWFTPGLGLRLQYSGLQSRGFTYDADAPYVRGGLQGDGYYKQRWSYMNLHGDVMFNLNALFGGYNAQRVYEVIPYVGAGFTHNYTKPRCESLSINAGIINRFRISDAIDINLEIGGVMVQDKFDGETGGDHGYDGLLNATVGVTYRFPSRGFRRPVPQLISQVELAALQAQLAEMGAQNLQLQQELTEAQNQPVAEVSETDVVVANTGIAPRTVFFTIGSAEISPREMMNLSYLADRMKQFPDATYTVNGYADSATGTPAFNQKLSQRRAQAVVDVLVGKFDINPDRLSISADGGVDIFGAPILNRVVLVESAD